MAKEKKAIKRSFKILFQVLIILVFLAVSLIDWCYVYKFMNVDSTLYIITYLIMVLANLGISVGFVNLVMSKFCKLDLKEVFNEIKNKIAYVILVLIVTAISTGICEFWFNIGM